MPGWRSNDALAVIRNQVRGAIKRELKPKIGYVTSFNPQTYAVRVRLEPESSANEAIGRTKVVETGWMPLSRPFGGNGWGFHAAPNADPNPPYGDMVIVVWPDGGHGMALGPFYNNIEKSFTGSVAGELWITHKNGAYIKLLNDGSLKFANKNGDVVELRADTSIVLTSSNGASITIGSAGDVVLASSGGGQVQISGANVILN